MNSSLSLDRRQLLLAGLGAVVPWAQQTKAPVVNGAEHAWVLNSKFPMTRELAVCPANLPDHEYSAEFLLSEMKTYKVDHVVISHVCYYGRDNSYASDCVKKYPGRFAAIGLLVGHRLYSPDDRENPSRLERLIKEDGLIGLRLSPIYNRDVVWLNDPVCYPLWKKAEQLGATFNIFLAPHQVGAGRRHGGAISRGECRHRSYRHDRHQRLPIQQDSGPLLDLAKLPNVYVRTSLHNPSKTKQMPYRDVWPFLRRMYDSLRPTADGMGEFLRVPNHEGDDSVLYGGGQGVDPRAHRAPVVRVWEGGRLKSVQSTL